MLSDDFLLLMKIKGWVLFDRVVDAALLNRLPGDLERAQQRCQEVRVRNGLTDDTSGTAHHVLSGDNNFLELLRRCPAREHVQAFLGGMCILNSFGGFINRPGDEAYITRVHRDIRSYTSGSPLMLNMLVMLDDFTEQNGATYMLTGSHHIAERPPDAFFFKYADRLLGKRGSVAVWDSNLWHSAGHNHSTTLRRALTLTFTRPFFKPQMDYAQLLGADCVDGLDEETKQLLGCNARIPGSLEAWYQPPERRCYKADQG